MNFASRFGLPRFAIGPIGAIRSESPLLKVHPAVSTALKTNRPIVALESTIITHGLPYPDNVHTAMAIEQAVRDQGAVPATTAFLDGVAHVGLTPTQIERLGEVGLKATKTSRRDVASVLAAGKGSVGATTVSGTMILANMVGIPIFATGGIGGVHRGGENSMDVSADLTELSRTPVAVFCSGPKSILDIPRTLEYLETLGVNVSTFNPSGQMPAFYTSQSGCKVPIISSSKEAAELIKARDTFGGLGGMLFGVPIPAQYEQDGLKIQAMVEQAIRESIELGIDKRGKEVTPWLLKRVNELSSGLSLVSNRALVINNATVAAKVAKELIKIAEAQANEAQELQQKSMMNMFQGHSNVGGGSKSSNLYLIGASAIDITCQAKLTSLSENSMEVASTWPGTNRLSMGGVACNMAESAQHLLHDQIMGEDLPPILLITAVGDDPLGNLVQGQMMQSGMRTDGIYTGTGMRTPSVVLQIDEQGDLLNGVVDMEELQLHPDHLQSELPSLTDEAGVIAFDANISPFTMKFIFEDKRHITIFEPTSIAKCTKILDAQIYPDVITPNEAELLAMYSHAKVIGMIPAMDEISPFFESAAYSNNISLEVFNATQRLCRLFNSVIIVKRGSNGVLLARPHQGAVNLQHFEASTIKQDEIVNTTGCGDTFTATIAACALLRLREELERQDGISRPREWSAAVWEKVIKVAQKAAILTLKSNQASSSELSSLGPDVQQSIEKDFQARLRL